VEKDILQINDMILSGKDQRMHSFKQVITAASNAISVEENYVAQLTQNVKEHKN
jgi:hypothetical protein